MQHQVLTEFPFEKSVYIPAQANVKIYSCCFQKSMLKHCTKKNNKSDVLGNKNVEN